MTGKRLIAVMAPLYVEENKEAEFQDNLREAKEIGVEAISVDVWWGLVMKNRLIPDWSYYEKIFSYIEKAGLSIVPIMSFHRCGGGPNDSVEIPLPEWLYDEVAAELHLESDDLRYESETGKKSSDSLPPWITGEKIIKKEMKRFMTSFTKQKFMKDLVKNDKIAEINISMGPTGELRYPSYTFEDGCNCPHRGHFQAYSRPAREAFRKWAMEQEHNWTEHYKDTPYRIRPPFGHLPGEVGINSGNFGKSRADKFAEEKLHTKEGYGKDFIEWYHQSLLNHFEKLIELANSAFSDNFANITFGIKIPGIHWQWENTEIPRYAEITAGIISYTNNIKSGYNLEFSVSGYEKLFESVQRKSAEIKRNIFVHFTALEMENEANKTSMAEALVMTVAETAKKYGITLCGENALQEVSSPYDIRTWEQISKLFDTGMFSGFTLLRLTEGFWNTDKESLKKFIERHNC